MKRDETGIRTEPQAIKDPFEKIVSPEKGILGDKSLLQ